MSNVGFIGLGIMGKPMAANLMKGGHTLYLYSRSGVAPELTAAGGKACASAKEVAQKAEIIIIMVPDTPDVEKALFGRDGVAEELPEPLRMRPDAGSACIIGSSTTDLRQSELG